MQIELTTSGVAAIRDSFSAQLTAFTEAKLGISDRRTVLAVLLRDADGLVEGGMWGKTRLGWLQLEFAYLPAHRRTAGLGSAMLAAMEREAASLGCRGVRTGSYSFQAPGFYVKRGYTAYARLENHPPGHADVSLYKAGDMGHGDTGLSVEHDPDPADRAVLRQLLLDYNDLHVGPSDFRDIAVVLRSPNGPVEGGLVGYTGRGWLHVELFVLPAAVRGQRIGTKILTMAHEEAKARGVIGTKLATSSFQARPFYEKLGYHVYGEIPDYQPGGHARYLMAQRFD